MIKITRRRPDSAPTAEPVPDQAEQRQRRRRRLPVHYAGSFDLAAEVEQLVGPVAARLSAEPRSAAFLPEVEDVAAAVHSVVLEAVRLVAEVDHSRRTLHIESFESRSRAIALLDQARPRPACPEIAADSLSTGTWVDSLIDHARAVSGALAELLAVARPPGGLRGRLSASERLEQVLRELDTAALALERRLDRVAAGRARIVASSAAPGPAASVAAELAALGIEL